MKSRQTVVYTRVWRSGTGLYARSLVEGLADNNYPVTFIAPVDAEHPPLRRPNVRHTPSIAELPAGKPALQRKLSSIGRVITGLSSLISSRLRARQFIVSIPDPYVFSLLPIMMLRLTGARVVFVCHDPIPHAWSLPAALRWLEVLGHKAMYWSSSKIVVLAKAGKATLVERMGVAESKIEVIPHGALPAIDAGPLPASRTLLLFGTIRRNKQTDIAMKGVVEARKMDCPVRLIVAGGVDDNDASFAAECREIASDHPDAIDLRIGFVSNEAVRELLSSCDACLLPYGDFNSQSGVAVLAGLSGRPVIATRAGGISDLIDDGLAAAEIQTPVTAECIAAAISGFYETPIEEWTRRAWTGRVSLLTALDWKSIAARFGAVVDRSS